MPDRGADPQGPPDVAPAPLTIERADPADAELVEALARLVPQLSASATPPGARDVEELVAGATLLVARAGGEIVGTLTLVVHRLPTGVRARIEDVVVDAAARGAGIGEALTREAVECARAAGARAVELTSHPSREAANRLYRRLGFEQRDTNVYRLTL